MVLPARIQVLVAVLVLLAVLAAHRVHAFPRAHLDQLREETREAFFHGWNSYLQHAYPDDEVTPITCEGRGSDKSNPDNMGLNDALGDYALQLVDALDTLAMMGEQRAFEAGVRLVERYVQFDVPSRVQVFESTIRVVGGLLSAHIYATSPELGLQVTGYNDSLLVLARDLADRLMPAFDTPTGIPLARVNLRYGCAMESITDTCAAGAGSLVLEFATLSRLTGDDKYEAAARAAFFGVWKRRSNLNLVGASVDSVSGSWMSAYTGIGASIDSFYEYALKSYILLGDEVFLNVFSKAYAAIKEHVYDGSWIYRNVHMVTGSPVTTWIDSLAAFFPGLQVLAGDVSAAVRHHLVYYKLWMTYAGTPERWNYATNRGSIELGWYGLRPEFAESNYLLYRATKDPFYLRVGAQILSDLQSRARAKCGYASIEDLKTGQVDDRMESFFLSETTKYLYLLFDVDNPLNSEDSNFVFSTEAHVLRVDVKLLPPQRQAEMKKKSLSPRIPRQRVLNHSDALQNSADKVRTDMTMYTPAPIVHQQRYFGAEYETYYDVVAAVEPDASAAVVTMPDIAVNGKCSSTAAFSGGFYSAVASWGEFYHLDGIYNFTPVNDSVFISPSGWHNKLASRKGLFSEGSPAQQRRRRRAVVALPPVHPGAVSAPLQPVTVMELFFPSEQRSLIARHGRDVETSSFDGHRVRFAQAPESGSDDGAGQNNYSTSGATGRRFGRGFARAMARAAVAGLGGGGGGIDGPMRVLTVGGVRVSGNVKVRYLMSRSMYEQDYFEVTRDGRVWLRGAEVVNLFVGG
ncbi:glycoside hydrolase [Limtongia smithiae]|uniref:glycoside hydrolase n=1 Tax=Limtongia smithiae TaxID=1125753 RepID=UPI0034CFCC0B